MRVPKFIADLALQPQICPDASGFFGRAGALVDRNLRMAENFRDVRSRSIVSCLGDERDRRGIVLESAL